MLYHTMVTNNIINESNVFRVSENHKVHAELYDDIQVLVVDNFYENPDLVKVLSQEYPRRVAVGIDAKEGMVATRGWLKQSEISSLELAKQLNDLELAAIISTDIATDGTLKGPNVQALREITEISINPVIASGGVGSIADLISLSEFENEGIEGIIVGRALYDGSIDLKEALLALKNIHFQDSINDKDKFLV